MAPKTVEKLITPDISLFHKLGARSRAFPMVVTELIDNSLDSWIELPSSKKKGKKLTIRISASEGKNARFVIEDNAGGMTQDELVQAMTVAKSHKTDNSKLIGNFGFGLKSAAMYVGGQFHIFTLSYKEPGFVNYVKFDKEKFVENGEWKLDFVKMTVSEAEKQQVFFKDGHGTVIDIKNERYRSANKKGIVNRLRRTFAPRIAKDPRLKINFDEYDADMNIILNLGEDKEEKVMAAGPFYTFWNNSVSVAEKEALERFQKVKKNPSDKEAIKFCIKTDYLRGDVKDASKEGAKENSEPSVIPAPIKWMAGITIPGVKTIKPTDIKDPTGKNKSRKVWGRVGILDRGMAHNYEYGFDLIKNGRVIEEFVLDKHLKDYQVGLVASNHNARIVGQLFLDDWETDHQKLSFIKDSKQWEDLAKFVAGQIDELKLLNISSNLQHPGDVLKKSGIVDENSPEVIADTKFETQAPVIQKDFKKALGSSAFKAALKNAESEGIKGTSKKPSGKPEKKAPYHGKGKAAPPKKEEPKHSTSTLTSLIPSIELIRDGEKSDMVTSEFKKESGKSVLKIYLNRDHPFLAGRESNELNPIGEFLAFDAYATFVLSNKENLTHEDFLNFRDTLLREVRRK
jgi:hypothetical protein